MQDPKIIGTIDTEFGDVCIQVYGLPSHDQVKALLPELEDAINQSVKAYRDAQREQSQEERPRTFDDILQELLRAL